MRNTRVTITKSINKDDWLREHYDDWSLKLMEEQEKEFQIYQLVEALVDNCRQLGEHVVELRHRVNQLTPPGQPEPFLLLHSDLYESFCDYAAYPEYKRLLKRLE
jgi:hypothetical protein